jgi:hypothetical protein
MSRWPFHSVFPWELISSINPCHIGMPMHWLWVERNTRIRHDLILLIYTISIEIDTKFFLFILLFFGHYASNHGFVRRKLFLFFCIAGIIAHKYMCASLVFNKKAVMDYCVSNELIDVRGWARVINLIHRSTDSGMVSRVKCRVGQLKKK